MNMFLLSVADPGFSCGWEGVVAQVRKFSAVNKKKQSLRFWDVFLTEVQNVNKIK